MTRIQDALLSLYTSHSSNCRIIDRKAAKRGLKSKHDLRLETRPERSETWDKAWAGWGLGDDLSSRHKTAKTLSKDETRSRWDKDRAEMHWVNWWCGMPDLNSIHAQYDCTSNTSSHTSCLGPAHRMQTPYLLLFFTIYWRRPASNTYWLNSLCSSTPLPCTCKAHWPTGLVITTNWLFPTHDRSATYTDSVG